MNFLSKCLLLLAGLTIWVAICTAQQACTFTHVMVQKLMDADFRYQLIERFGPVRFCDPYCAGPCNFMRARRDAEEAFTKIKGDEKTFRLIREHLALREISEASPKQKADIFGEYVKLVCSVTVEPQGENRTFTLKTTSGFRIQGLVRKTGEVVVVDKRLEALICPK